MQTISQEVFNKFLSSFIYVSRNDLKNECQSRQRKILSAARRHRFDYDEILVRWVFRRLLEIQKGKLNIHHCMVFKCFNSC